MVIVEIDQIAGIDEFRLATLDSNTEQSAASVEHPPVSVRRPVWRFDHFVGGKDYPLIAVQANDRQLCGLVLAETATAARKLEAHANCTRGSQGSAI